MQSDRELEEIIDAAVPGYSEVEPPAGLEHRILARALAEEPRPKRFPWRWSLAIPATACLLVLILVTRRQTPPSQIPANTAKHIATTPAPTIAVVPNSPERPNLRTHLHPLPAQVARIPQPLPRQDVFPSPTPPTAEEEAMIALARAQARIGSQPADVEAELEIPEVRIAELEIKPVSTIAEQRLGPSAATSSPTSQQP